MTGRAVYSVTVAGSALGELILAVHTAAEQRGSAPAQRWRYGNIVGIGKPRMRDLDIETARTKHGARHPIAAVTVVTHHRISVDVVFEVDGSDASAQFLCATTESVGLADQEASWAEFLATGTSATLTADDMTARLHRYCVADFE